jgi:hypothetical protein
MIRIGSEIVQLVPQIALRTMILNRSETLVFNESSNVVSIAFKNVGTDNATINGAKLNAGDPMYSISVAETAQIEGNFAVNFANINTRIVEVVIAARIGFREVRTPINIIEKL